MRLRVVVPPLGLSRLKAAAVRLSGRRYVTRADAVRSAGAGPAPDADRRDAAISTTRDAETEES